MLDLAMVLALAQNCAPSTAPSTLAAIAHVESRFDPLAIGVNRGSGPVSRPRTAEEATGVARALISRGANIDLGLAQINSRNLDWLGLSVAEAFDPCRNLAAAAQVLEAGYQPIDDTNAGRQRALRIALSRYNTGHAERGFRNGYVGKVERAARRLFLNWPTHAPSARIDTRSPASVAEPEPVAPAWDVFARAGDGILVFATLSEPQR